MSALQGTQPDTFLWIKYGYVALTSLWVYDYVLCIPDSVTYLVESRWGLGTWFYLGCSHFPFAFLLLGMLAVFQPDASNALCRSYDEANIYIGFLTMLSAECIFVIRALAVYHRERKWVVFATILVIVHVVPMIVCFHKFASLVSGECSVPGFIRYLDTEANTIVCVMYDLMLFAEFEILLFLLYRTVDIRSSGWRVDNRLKRGLLQHNLLYLGCSCAFVVGLWFTVKLSPFPVAHLVADRYHVVVQALMVTRMHRDFWKSDRAFCGTSREDISLSTFMVATPDII
ncbi:hypothetical protein EDB19DRAFT_595441 [Suillus lakei]|nr:hypothetical protein EDB19DRAFT_595441 [Suillus lakei]